MVHDLPLGGRREHVACGLDSVSTDTGVLEALQIAMCAENTAQQLCTMPMNTTSDPKAKNRLKVLADQEAKHIRLREASTSD